MDTPIQDQHQLRQIIGEMEAALDQSALPAGALEGWKTTFQEIQYRSEASPDSPSISDVRSVQHLQDRALTLLSTLTQSR